MKTQIFLSHSNCTHLLERDFFQGFNRSFLLTVQPSVSLGTSNGAIRRRHLKHAYVVAGSDTKVKGPSHQGKNSKKKDGDQTKTRKTSPEANGASTTAAIALGGAGLAPADFCDVEEELDEIDEDDELHYFRALVLDLSYRPINVVNWKRALCLEILEKADVLEYYDQAVQSTNRAYLIPAVLRVWNGRLHIGKIQQRDLAQVLAVSSFVHAPKHKTVRLNLNRNNVFMRDKFRCQYCNTRDDLTIDHVLAASRGGGWEWDNLVTACSTCNVRKGDKTVEEARMKLLKPPREPKELDSLDLPPNYKTFRVLSRHRRSTPTQWLDYLPNRPSPF